MDDGGTQECIEDRPAYCLSRCDNEKFPRNLHEVVSTFTNFSSKVYQGLGLGAKGLNVHFGSDRKTYRLGCPSKRKGKEIFLRRRGS